MIVTRLLVIGGQIICRTYLDALSCDSENTARVAVAWAALEQGVKEAHVQMTDNTLVTVGFVTDAPMPVESDTSVPVLPETDGEEGRKFFYIKSSEHTLLCYIVPQNDLAQPDTSLMGFIAGSYYAVKARQPQSFKYHIDFSDEQELFWNQEQLIRNLSPAYVYLNYGVPHQFFDVADCFAITRLKYNKGNAI